MPPSQTLSTVAGDDNMKVTFRRSSSDVIIMIFNKVLKNGM